MAADFLQPMSVRANPKAGYRCFGTRLPDRLCAAIKTLSKVQAEISEQQRRETCSAAFLTKSLDCTIYSVNDIINYNVLRDICPNVKGETKWKQSV